MNTGEHNKCGFGVIEELTAVVGGNGQNIIRNASLPMERSMPLMARRTEAWFFFNRTEDQLAGFTLDERQ